MPRKSTPKAVAANASEPAVFNLDDFTSAAYAEPDVREITRRDGTVLTVTLDHLTTRQANRIPGTGPLSGTYKAMAQYVKAWDLSATNTATGEVADIPAPGSPEATEWMGEGNEWELLELLDNADGSQIYMWLTNPAGMQLATEQGKLGSKASAPTDTPASANGKASA